ncbi:MAG: GerW family sporulation protein [Clostridiales bacterium]|jgi:uncharacterized spore protein YtfJ|nr:GerW family sporulation protein [Clostridiales bacterium]
MSADLNKNIDALFDKMRGFVSTKTVVGDPVIQGGVIIVPLIDVSFGVGVGISDSDGTKEKEPAKKSMGGGGMGGYISPSAVLVIVDGNVSLVNIKNQNSLNKLIDLAPSLLGKLNIDKLFRKNTREAPEFSDE